jgi:hypothetical protein
MIYNLVKSLLFLFFLLVVLTLAAKGCTPPCQVKTTRCNQEILEICGPNEKWHRVMDCSQITPITKNAVKHWKCYKTNCVPKGN